METFKNVGLAQFHIYFKSLVRRATIGISDKSDRERCNAYAKHINEAETTVWRVATIRRERPTRKILDAVGKYESEPFYPDKTYEEQND